MSVTNVNSWSSWSNGINEAVSFQNTLSQQATNAANQVQNLAQELKNGTITPAQYQSDIAALNASMTSFLANLSSQYPDIASNPAFSQDADNLSTAWQTTLTSAGFTVPNPNNNPTPPTLPVTYNSNGTVSIQFTTSYIYNSAPPHNVTLGCLNSNGTSNYPWLPSDSSEGSGNVYFSQALQQMAAQGSATFSWNGETIELVRGANDNSVTITIVAPAANLQKSISPPNPNTSALSNFASHPLGD